MSAMSLKLVHISSVFVTVKYSEMTLTVYILSMRSFQRLLRPSAYNLYT